MNKARELLTQFIQTRILPMNPTSAQSFTQMVSTYLTIILIKEICSKPFQELQQSEKAYIILFYKNESKFYNYFREFFKNYSTPFYFNCLSKIVYKIKISQNKYTEKINISMFKIFQFSFIIHNKNYLDYYHLKKQRYQVIMKNVFGHTNETIFKTLEKLKYDIPSQIINQHELVDKLFILTKGYVKIVDSKTIISFIYPIQIINEFSLLDKPSQYNFIVGGETKIFSIDIITLQNQLPPEYLTKTQEIFEKCNQDLLNNFNRGKSKITKNEMKIEGNKEIQDLKFQQNILKKLVRKKKQQQIVVAVTRRLQADYENEYYNQQIKEKKDNEKLKQMKNSLQKMLKFRDKNLKAIEFSQIFGEDSSLIDQAVTNRFYPINNSQEQKLIPKEKLLTKLKDQQQFYKQQTQGEYYGYAELDSGYMCNFNKYKNFKLIYLGKRKQSKQNLSGMKMNTQCILNEYERQKSVFVKKDSEFSVLLSSKNGSILRNSISCNNLPKIDVKLKLKLNKIGKIKEKIGTRLRYIKQIMNQYGEIN